MITISLLLLLLAIPAAVFGFSSAATPAAVIARVVALVLLALALGTAWSARHLDHRERFDND